MPNSRWNGSTKSDFHFVRNLSLNGFMAGSSQSWKAGAEDFFVAAQFGTVRTASVSLGNNLSGGGTAANNPLKGKRMVVRIDRTLLISLERDYLPEAALVSSKGCLTRLGGSRYR